MGTELTFWERLVSGAVIHVLWFVGTFILVPVLTALGVAAIFHSSEEAMGTIFQKTLMSGFPASAYWMAVIAASIAAALLGPTLFARENERGRGALQDIRQGSGRKFRDLD